MPPVTERKIFDAVATLQEQVANLHAQLAEREKGAHIHTERLAAIEDGVNRLVREHVALEQRLESVGAATTRAMELLDQRLTQVETGNPEPKPLPELPLWLNNAITTHEAVTLVQWLVRLHDFVETFAEAEWVNPEVRQELCIIQDEIDSIETAREVQS